MMRSMCGSRAEIHEKRFIRRIDIGFPDEFKRVVYQVRGKMISLFRCGRRSDRVVILNQVRVVLIGLATEETIEVFESPAERPACVRSRRG